MDSDEESEFYRKLKRMQFVDRKIIDFNMPTDIDDDSLDPNCVMNYFGGLDDLSIKYKYQHVAEFVKRLNYADAVCESYHRSFNTRETKSASFGSSDEVSIMSNSILKSDVKAQTPFKLAEISAAAVINQQILNRLSSKILMHLSNIFDTKANRITLRAGGNLFRKTYDFETIIRHHLYRRNGMELARDTYFEKLS